MASPSEIYDKNTMTENQKTTTHQPDDLAWRGGQYVQISKKSDSTTNRTRMSMWKHACYLNTCYLNGALTRRTQRRLLHRKARNAHKAMSSCDHCAHLSHVSQLA